MLLVPLGGEIWECIDIDFEAPESEYEPSAWLPSAEARATFESWDIEWVALGDTRAFVDAHFRGLNESVVWRSVAE